MGFLTTTKKKKNSKSNARKWVKKNENIKFVCGHKYFKIFVQEAFLNVIIFCYFLTNKKKQFSYQRALAIS